MKAYSYVGDIWQPWVNQGSWNLLLQYDLELNKPEAKQEQ